MAEMKYKIGDKIRVRKDLVADRYYERENQGSSLFCNTDMVKICGTKQEITSVNPFDNTYKITNSIWSWSVSMLEDADDRVELPLEVGQELDRAKKNYDSLMVALQWDTVQYKRILKFAYGDKGRQCTRDFSAENLGLLAEAWLKGWKAPTPPTPEEQLKDIYVSSDDVVQQRIKEVLTLVGKEDMLEV